jgi:hypothetical protein
MKDILYQHHPLLMNEQGRKRLPETSWHEKVQDRYPSGSTAELFRRAQAFFYRELARMSGNDMVLTEPPMQPKTELLEGLVGPVIDIIAPTLIIEQDGIQKTVVIIEDHAHQGDVSYTMGKSTIIQGLLNLPEVDAIIQEKLGIVVGERVTTGELLWRLQQIAFDASENINIHQRVDSGIRLLTGDVTFIGMSADGRLVALPTVGTKEDFIFDLARVAMRKLIVNYNRTDDDIMQAQVNIAEKIRLSDSVWADASKTYPIDEIVCLAPDFQLSAFAAWGEDINLPQALMVELQSQLAQNPIYIASQIGYWALDKETHARQVGELLSGEVSYLPRIRYMRLKNPKEAAVLSYAMSLLREEYKT